MADPSNVAKRPKRPFKVLSQPNDIDDRYETQPVLTYLGNKRKLLKPIQDIVNDIKEKLNVEKLNILDAFSGSGVVARSLVRFANEMHANDWETYAFMQAQCFLNKPSAEDQTIISTLIDTMNNLDFTHESIICANYAPRDSSAIQMEERCFFTRENALRIDTMRHFISMQPERLQPYLLAPLLIKASIHTNTSGQFQAFHKNREGRGAWGGEFARCLPRITGLIKLDAPVFSNVNYRGYAYNMEVLDCLNTFNDNHLDVIYLDPPYNHRQYSYLYFLLNIIAQNRLPAVVTGTAGATVPSLRNNSDFCVKSKVEDVFKRLLELCTRKSRFTILSYSNESLINPEQMKKLLNPYKVTVNLQSHSRYNVRGDEQTRDAPKKTEEYLYVISKK
jgi:adenine-specific DNA-methyltransferase